MQRSSEKVLLIIRGVPGAGKSTIAFSLVDSGLFYDYFEADMYFEGLDGYNYNKSLIKEAHDWCYKEVKKEMLLGRSVIVSNTSTQYWQYKRYIDLAQELGYNIQIMVLESSFKSTHNVPEETITRMQKELKEDTLESFGIGCRNNNT